MRAVTTRFVADGDQHKARVLDSINFGCRYVQLGRIDEIVGGIDEHDRRGDSLEVRRGIVVPRGVYRSEEHTSELQSHSDLVCRLLLEKKKRIECHRGAGYRRRSCCQRSTVEWSH